MTAAVVPHRYGMVAVDSVVPHPDNPRRGDVEAIGRSIEANGFFGALVVQESTRHILVGNHRWMGARAQGLAEVPAIIVDCDDAAARRILTVDNRAAELAEWDEEALAALLSGMAAEPGGLDGVLFTEADLAELVGGSGGDAGGPPPTLADRFGLVPFDVLDARSGWWQDRKRRWLASGLASELGRLGGHRARAFKDPGRGDPRFYDLKDAAEKRLGRKLSRSEFIEDYYDPASRGVGTGISIFDPVLCELAYRWFCPPGGVVVDPFAGGSVRGLVAGMLGRAYAGNDLSAGQVEANRAQAADFGARGLVGAVTPAGGGALPGPGGPVPSWCAGDARTWVTTLQPESADMIFTCPPYYGLERYSDDPADLSAMSTADFDAAYAEIIAGTARALRDDRFAVIVTGDVRDGRGRLRDLRGVTIAAAARAGLAYADGAVLVTVTATGIGIGRAFTATRCLSRSHQDVLVFCKGNRKRAAQACGPPDFGDPPPDDAGESA